MAAVNSGAIVVIRAQQPSAGDEGTAEIKLIWTNAGGAKTDYPNGREVGRVNNREAGITGEGFWALHVFATKARPMLKVYLKYTGKNVPQLAAKTTLSFAALCYSPLAQLQPVCCKMQGDGSWQAIGEQTVSELPGFWNNGNGAVEVTIAFADRQFIQPAVPAAPVSPNFGMEKAGMYLQESYRAGRLTDALLVTADEKEIPVHRILLAARSDVFAAMFTHDTDEKKSGICKIIDTEHAILKQFVDALYGLDVEASLAANVEDMFVVADKYQTAELRSRCVDILKATLTLGNVVERFVLAKDHDLADLVEEVGAYVREHLTEFYQRDGMDEVYAKANKYRKDFCLLLAAPNSKKRDAAALEE